MLINSRIQMIAFRNDHTNSVFWIGLRVWQKLMNRSASFTG